MTPTSIAQAKRVRHERKLNKASLPQALVWLIAPPPVQCTSRDWFRIVKPNHSNYGRSLLCLFNKTGGLRVDALCALGAGREDRYELLGVWDWNSSDGRKKSE